MSSSYVDLYDDGARSNIRDCKTDILKLGNANVVWISNFDNRPWVITISKSASNTYFFFKFGDPISGEMCQKSGNGVDFLLFT